MKFKEMKILFLLFEDLQKISSKLNRLNEIECNFGLTKRGEKKRNELEENAKKIFFSLNDLVDDEISLEIEKDPRTSAIKIVLENHKDIINI